MSIRTVVRGLVTKMPGFQYFSGLNLTLLNLQGIISIDDYNKFKETLYALAPEYEDNFNDATAEYEFNDGVPKKELYVRLNSDVTDEQRNFVANGIRNYFIGIDNFIFIKQDFVDNFSSVTDIFNLFVGIIATISLFLAFFLLLISMTQNVNDASWEFGVLRSMGLTSAEGMRMYMYEAYIVVIVAAILGIIVGFVTSTAVAFQFYSFIELPVELKFPWIIFSIMIGMSLITVFFAVYIPVKQINRQ